jgi:hypothetical protein
MGLIKNSTLVPPFNHGQNVAEKDWNRIFPKRPKANFEKQEDYEVRRKETTDRKNES